MFMSLVYFSLPVGLYNKSRVVFVSWLYQFSVSVLRCQRRAGLFFLLFLFSLLLSHLLFFLFPLFLDVAKLNFVLKKRKNRVPLSGSSSNQCCLNLRSGFLTNIFLKQNTFQGKTLELISENFIYVSPFHFHLVPFIKSESEPVLMFAVM